MLKADRKLSYFARVQIWGSGSAKRVEDIGKAILRFIPDGLEGVFDRYCVLLPIIGKAFEHAWTAKFIKAMTGITILQWLTQDIARFVLNPLGHVIGILLGLVLAPIAVPSPYQGKLSVLIPQVAPQAVVGALIGLSLSGVLGPLMRFNSTNTLLFIALVMLLGGMIGFLVKLTYVIANQILLQAHARTIRKNVERAKTISTKLKVAAKKKAKVRIMQLTQKTIQQINGPQLQPRMQEFYQEHFETIANHAYKKIDRHLNYLADRACHGDVNALRRLYGLVPGRTTLSKAHNETLDNMLERIFNRRALEKMRDDIDSVFDMWNYRQLQKQAVKSKV